MKKKGRIFAIEEDEPFGDNTKVSIMINVPKNQIKRVLDVFGEKDSIDVTLSFN